MKTKIKDVDSALRLFEEAAVTQASSTESGEYKIGNKACNTIYKAVGFLKKHNALLRLKQFFVHPSMGPRAWAATYLLPITENESVQVLLDMSKRTDIHGGGARTALKEWQKGNLRSL